MILSKLLKKFAFYIILPNAIFSTFVVQNALAQNLKEYENTNLGIRLSYPSTPDWSLYPDIFDEPCSSFTELMCSFFWMNEEGREENERSNFTNMWFLTIQQHSIENPKFLEWCNCKSLPELMRHKYELAQTNAISRNDKLSFINDNQTTVGKNNYSAWQMEVSKMRWEGLDRIYSKELDVFVKINNSFYDFDFTAANEIYSKRLPQVKAVIDSMEFFSTQKPKTPSFMNTSKTS